MADDKDERAAEPGEVADDEERVRGARARLGRRAARRRRARRARRDAPLGGPRHGRGGPRPVPGHEARHRAGDRRTASTTTSSSTGRSRPTTSRRSRSGWRASVAADHPFVRRELPLEEGRAFFVERGQPFKVEILDDLAAKAKADGAPMPPTTLLRARPVHRPVQGPARRDHGQDRAVQAARRRRRVLARRREAPDAPADLRHGLADAGGARRLPLAARGGEEARPPPARRPARPVQLPRRLAGLGVLAPEGPADLADARGRDARAPGAARLPGGLARRSSSSEKLWQQSGPLGPLRATTCSSSSRGPDVQPQADELPGVDVHLPLAGCARTATCRCATASTAGSTATSAPARCRGLTRVRQFIQDDAPHLRPAGPARRRDRGAARRGPRGVRLVRPRAALHASRRSPTRRSATRRCGSAPRRLIREALDAAGVDLRGQAQGRHVLRARRSTSTSTTPSAASGRWRRSRST